MLGRFFLFGALFFATALLGACAELEQAEVFLDSAQTQQAVSVLKAGATAFICAVSDVSALSYTIESQSGAGQSMIGTDGKVYVVSAQICDALGGVVSGQGVIP